MKKIKIFLYILPLLVLIPNFTLADTDNSIVYTKCEINSYEEQLADNLYLVDKKDIKQDCVVQSTPDQRIYLATNDTNYATQWSLRNIGQSILGQTGINGIDIDFTNAYPKISNTPKGNTKVAVIDTGVTTISELSGQVISGYNFISNSNNANDDNGHGTFVSSIIASKVNNSTGIAGINDRVNIVPIKILDSEGTGLLSDLVKGIQYAIDQNVNIINLSLASTSFDPVLNNIIDTAYQRGIIVVAAAGNSGINITSPSVSPLNNDGNKNWVIGVGAIDNRNNRPDYSNYGLGIDVVAPGDAILGYNQNNILQYRSGTSMAAAVVTGVLSAWRDYYGSLSTDEAHNFINNTSKSGKLISMDNAMLTSNFPNGLLIKGTNSPKVYYIDNGKKRPIESPNMFNSQFKWEDLVITTPVEINSIPTGAEMTYRDGSLISSRGVVYVVSEGKRRQIDSPSTFVQKGYKWSNIVAVSDAELGAHPVGEILRIGDRHPNGSLLLAPDGKVYVLREGKRRWVPSPLIFEARYRWESIIAVSQEVINSYELGENEYYPDGLLIRGSGPKVYMMQNNVKQHIWSPEVFESYGLSWSQIKRATDSEINLIPELGSFSSLKKYNGGSLLGSRSDGRIYRVNNNETLEYIPSANIFISWGYNWNDVIRLSGNVINQYNRNGTVGFADGRLILYEGKVYLIENGAKRWVSTLSIFNARGYRWNDVIPVSADEFNANSMGSPII
jgi:hypothetical protein